MNKHVDINLSHFNVFLTPVEKTLVRMRPKNGARDPRRTTRVHRDYMRAYTARRARAHILTALLRLYGVKLLILLFYVCTLICTMNCKTEHRNVCNLLILYKINFDYRILETIT